MKFICRYRTGDNKKREVVVTAANRDAAFADMKSRGIRPEQMLEAPGFFNKLLGKGKRWMAIGILAILVVVALIWGVSRSPASADDSCLERGQIYGDPAVIRAASRNGWSAVFSDAGDRWLACHAIPARPCECEKNRKGLPEIAKALAAGRTRPVVIATNDYAEIATIKRMVNCMKRELNEYLRDGGTVEQYMRRSDIRLRTEELIYREAVSESSRMLDLQYWKRKNASLRAMGLPMVDFGGEWDGPKKMKIPH